RRGRTAGIYGHGRLHGRDLAGAGAGDACCPARACGRSRRGAPAGARPAGRASLRGEPSSPADAGAVGMKRSSLVPPRAESWTSHRRPKKPSCKQHEGRGAVSGKQFVSTRKILLVLCVAASLSALAAPAAAQVYPNCPVKIVVPFVPGGPTEFIIRLLAD